ncbi:MAG: MFS transporter [Hungatella sp.]|nr:MFS transporter [Hungatella sp.]
MEKKQILQKNAGLFTFFISGICVISSGIVVSLLQEEYGFAYNMTGTLLSLVSVGNLLSGFMTAVLNGKLGMKKTAVLLTAGYGIGYLVMGMTTWMTVLMLAFFLLGIAKGCVINTCTILVGNNSQNRTVGMNLMHSCYAFGALLCPFFIAATASFGSLVPLFVLAAMGTVMWAVFFMTPMTAGGKQKEKGTDWSFLKSRKFWLLTGLLFCQNAAEFSVNGWMVTYFKGRGILSGILSTYTVTVMWSATLIARLLIAFVFPIKNTYSALIKMGIGCIVFYIGMMMTDSQIPAVLLLFAFAFSMAGMNPTAMASAGKMTTPVSIGIMLPVASAGAILMPWIAGIISEQAGLTVGMASNIVPCIGLLIFSVLVKQMGTKEEK